MTRQWKWYRVKIRLRSWLAWTKCRLAWLPTPFFGVRQQNQRAKSKPLYLAFIRRKHLTSLLLCDLVVPKGVENSWMTCEDCFSHILKCYQQLVQWGIQLLDKDLPIISSHLLPVYHRPHTIIEECCTSNPWKRFPLLNHL